MSIPSGVEGRFAGRTVVISGASRGLGRELALGFAREGAWIAVGYRDRAEQAEQTLALRNTCRELGARRRAFSRPNFDLIGGTRDSQRLFRQPARNKRSHLLWRHYLNTARRSLTVSFRR